MTVYVYPADRFGCGYYRMIWPAESLIAAGHDIKIIMPHERGKHLSAAVNQKQELVDVKIPDDAEVIVLQRVSHMFLTQAVSIIRAKGVAVVIDIDDDLAAIHGMNPAKDSYDPAKPPREHSWVNVVKSCHAATTVITSADALHKFYAPHGNGITIRNYIPERYLQVPHIDSDVIGWPGSIRSHPNDLQVVGHAISRLVRQGHQFTVIGPEGQGSEIQRFLQLSEPPSLSGQLDLLTNWPDGISKIGIGIAPLDNTRFNRSKSRLKPLEMAAVGVPCVMSPRIEYERLHRAGIGLLADKPKDWYRHLHKLATDDALRIEMSQRSRDIASQYTIESNAWRWWEAWMHALKIERS